MMIGKYTVTSSNASSKQIASVRVKLNKVILAEVFLDHHSAPLRFIRTRPLSDARREFVAQLTACGVPAEDIALILKMPE